MIQRYAPLKRKKRVNPVRRKPRPGRLKGADLQALRALVWTRQGRRCAKCGKLLPLYGSVYERMHLAHIRGKRMWGDGEQNVRGLCFEDHHAEHNPKACPKKDGRR